MSQSLREFIRAREADIQKQIESLRSELRDLALARQAIDGAPAPRNPTVQRGTAPTIKEMILEVLEKRPNGGVADQIIEWVKADYGVDVPRSSMSPQLSRLKSDLSVHLHAKTKVWQLPKHVEHLKPFLGHPPQEVFPGLPETSDFMS
jgi:hypothetical protein